MTSVGRSLQTATVALASPARWTLAAGILALPLFAVGVPAGATAGDSVTVNGSTRVTVATNEQISLSATAEPTCVTGLRVRVVTATLTGPTGSHSTTSRLASKPGMCNKSVELTSAFTTPPRNGSYTVTLENGSASNSTTASVAVEVPPAKVQHFRVAADGTEATFAWTVSPEPDVIEYAIATAAGNPVETVPASSACGNETTCAARIDLGSSAADHTVSFVVRAVRCGVSCSHHVEGPASSEASAHFGASNPPPAPPVTSPPQPIVTAPPATNPPATASSRPTKRSHPHHTSTPSIGTSSAPAAVGGGSSPATGSSSAPAGVSPPASPSAKPSSVAAASSSSDANNSGGDWAVRGVAIALMLGALAMFVRALSTRAGNA